MLLKYVKNQHLNTFFSAPPLKRTSLLVLQDPAFDWIHPLSEMMLTR